MKEIRFDTIRRRAGLGAVRMFPKGCPWLAVLAGLLLLADNVQAFTYSGRVTDGGVGISGITINYTWTFGSGHTTTGSGGYWSSGGWSLFDGSATFSPAQSGYTFSPSSRSYGAGVSDVSGVNFSRISYTISGTITRGGIGLPGVTVSLTGAMTMSTTTDVNGNFSFVRLRTGSYTITPSRAGTIFSPANRTTTLSPSRAGQNFTVLVPTVTTLPATNVAYGDAVLNGTLEGEGTLDTTAWFEYGTGGAFGSATPDQVFPPDASLTTVGAAVTNLSAGVSYNFRLVAASTNGTNFGATLDFPMPFPAAASAVNLDGANDYVQVGADPILTLTSNLTIEAWINATGPGNGGSGSGGIIVNREGEYEIARFADGTIRYAIANTSPGWTSVNTGVVVPLNEWTHIAFTYDANAVTNQIQLYTNGVVAYTAQGSGAVGDAATSMNDFRIGARQAATAFFDGQIDEVRIWNVARSASEIQDNYQRHLPGDTVGLVAYFQFNEVTGTSTPNSVPGSLAATLQNGASLTYSGALVRDPVVTTVPATPVLATKATLQSVVNPAQSDTVAYFEYGETIAYGSVTAGQDVGSGLANVPVSSTITNLQPGTTYHYHAVAFNSTGTTVGEDQTFTTLVIGVGWPTSTKVTGGFASSPRHVVDAQGNTYVAGLFSGSATFKTTMVSSNDTPDAFVGKLGRGADWLWNNRVTLDTTGAISVNAIALDGAKNVYIAGQFTGTATFGTNDLTAGADGDLFVAKLNSAGDTWLWARSAGASQPDSANALAVTPAGTVFIAGHFGGSVDFGTNNLASTGGSQDIFVAQLDTDGNWLWASGAGGAGTNDSALALVLNSAGDAYIAGRFQGTNATFGTTTHLDAAGGANDTDLFVARISTNGLWLLARRAGSNTGDDTGTGLAIDAAGQIYLLGKFAGSADYNSSIGNLNEGGGTNLFVAKLNPNANMLWYAQAGVGSAESIAVDNANRVYVTGDFYISTRFGNPSIITLASGGGSDVFVARLDSATGAWIWATSIGSSGSETRGSVGVDAEGGVVVSGTFQNTVQLGYVLLTTANDTDVFIARFDANAVVEHNNYIVGQPIPVPLEAQDPNRTDGGAIAQPTITIREQDQPDSDAQNSFVWSLAEHKLYPIRQVTAVFKWPLTTDPTNTTAIVTAVGRTFYPTNPVIQVANVPAELEPAVAGFPLKFLNLSFTTINGASVDASSKVFTAPQPGWSVLQFLDTGGETPNPAIHPSKFEVVRTVNWNDPKYLLDNQPAEIGKALSYPPHEDPTGRNGFVYFANAFYDGAGDERAYDRATRTGPIIPVNKDTTSPTDDLVVVWYRPSTNGVAWPSTPVRYLANWPTNADELVLASGFGSGTLDPLVYPSKRVYNQPDRSLPGFNPNEEHAALYGDTLYALRNDLNAVIGVSEPYTLLKYHDPASGQWAMKVYKVVTTNATFTLSYDGVAGSELPLPQPLSSLDLCSLSNRVVSGPGFQDYVGRLYARAAGPDTGGTNIVARYWYPLQADFFYDLNLDGVPDAAVGTCVPWLDRRPGGVAGVPADVNYNIDWPTDVPTLQTGETLLNAKFGLPDIRHFASASVIYDQGNPLGTNALESLVRLFDPLSARTLQLAPDFVLPATIATANEAGKLVFTDLPYSLRSRLRYDDLNKQLSFSGLLDESVDYGGPDDPLLLLNVLSPRERDRIKQLSAAPAFTKAIDDLYDLTRNPHQLDADRDGQPDKGLLVGLTYGYETNQISGVITTNIIPEQLGDGPKALTAGPGTGTGFVTVIENNDPSLSGLPVTLHIMRIADGPFRGDIKVLYPDNVFDEKLTLRHSADFGGEPQRFEFQWYYMPDDPGLDHTVLPTVNTNGDITDLHSWTPYPSIPPGTNGFNDITIGDGGVGGLLTLSDNWFLCRYRGYSINGQTNWSDWVGVIGGGGPQLAEGWVKRVVFGLNPFEARTKAFHENETVTFASMLQQAGPRYEGDIAFNPSGNSINNVGLIQAYETVLHRAKKLSVDAVPGIDYQPANDALLLAAGRIADFCILLGNEAYADAADPTIGFRTDSAGYGALAPSIFTFENQVDSLLEEEMCLLRGRDDRSATVRAAPVYNRLFWNFTHGEGEVAYAQAYDITDQNHDGFINADDARIMYPQGHGDAWGHYLTALTTYYSLLQNTNFAWVPRAESILLAGVPVSVDYLDERKFAQAAAAEAQTGAQIVDLTYRYNYVDDPAGQYQGYKDTDSTRAWGVSGWAHRAGSGAFFDWVTANAILPATDPNTNHVGIQKIDRTTVPELDQIVAGYEAVQSQVEKANEGLNPLGLAKNVVPFDIDPTQIDAGKTHFEQIYDRALSAMNNAVTVFNHANDLSQALRSLQDSVNNFSQNVDDQERDYKNRLIEIFGYPYVGDIGAGKTFPSGYDGPDIYHYMYVNSVPLNGEPALSVNNNITAYYKPLFPKLAQGLASIRDFFFGNDIPNNQVTVVTQGIMQVTYPLSTASYGLTAPAEWGTRRAPGELQQALSDLLQSQARLKQALANYDALIKQIDDSTELLNARFGLQADTIEIRNKADSKVRTLRQVALQAKITAAVLKGVIEKIDSATDITTESLPKVLGFSNDATAPARGAVKTLGEIGKIALKVGEGVAEGAAEGAKTAEEDVRRSADLEIQAKQSDYEIQQQLKALEQLVRQEPGQRLEAFALREALMQQVGRYQSTLAKGLRLLDERIAFRKKAAAETQQSRYQDMTFRIFRNDAIQKYRAQFDLAAEYVFLAAEAYDYETELLGGSTGSGSKFLTDIIRQRSLGQMDNGAPIAGTHGLADPLARLGQNFGVLKGQLGFNNPQTETGRFSLRGELSRLRDDSDDAWRAELKKDIVPNLWDIPEFRRYCRPFAPESAGPQPGLVIRFPTTVTFGLNYFGWPLGGGDSAYDSTLFATKVRSAGVWFENYLGSGLSQTPRVYFVPVGADVMRSPSGNDLETREWRVVDQKIPVPFPIGASALTDPAWIPMDDSLSDTFADIRRFSSFRAYHDSGAFDPSETISDSRLIGRSVWNTDWMLIIPGGTFLFDPNQGLQTFINSVGDIKIFFQTYSYSGN